MDESRINPSRTALIGDSGRERFTLLHQRFNLR